MATLPVRHERRAAQRFDFHLPVSIRQCGSGAEELGFTQNISARGAFIYIAKQMPEGCDVELTLMMPSEITLTENMRVRCRGKVLRVSQPSASSKVGLAVHLEGYEFLPDQPESVGKGSYERISSLHEHPLAADETPAPRPIPKRPILL
jgi:PilZ domain